MFLSLSSTKRKCLAWSSLFSQAIVEGSLRTFQRSRSLFQTFSRSTSSTFGLRNVTSLSTLWKRNWSLLQFWLLLMNPNRSRSSAMPLFKVLVQCWCKRTKFGLYLSPVEAQWKELPHSWPRVGGSCPCSFNMETSLVGKKSGHLHWS